MTPDRCALSGSRFSIDIAVTLLPEPDSPTSATVVCSGISKLTPLTAGTSVNALRSPNRKATQVANAQQHGQPPAGRPKGRRALVAPSAFGVA